jgi:hypothetical protein
MDQSGSTREACTRWSRCIAGKLHTRDEFNNSVFSDDMVNVGRVAVASGMHNGVRRESSTQAQRRVCRDELRVFMN